MTKQTSATNVKVSAPARREPAGTVEIGTIVNGNEYFTYMVPGACNLRSFYGLNQITKKGVNPADIVAAIVQTGISGSIMVFTDAYGRGADAQKLKEFVESNNLGHVTLSLGSGNQYMGGGKVVAAIYEYEPPKLLAWYETNYGKLNTNEWYTRTDRFHMDSVFYQFGGRPKDKARASEAILPSEKQAALAG